MHIPSLHPNLHSLIIHGRQRKWMSYEELNTTIPDEMVHPDKIVELLVILQHHQIELINYEDPRLRTEPHFYAPMHTNLRFKRDNPWMTFGLKIEVELAEEPSDDDDTRAPAAGHEAGEDDHQ